MNHPALEYANRVGIPNPLSRSGRVWQPALPERRRNNAAANTDHEYMCTKIRKFWTDKIDTWNKRKFWLICKHVNGWDPAVYMSYMSQNFRLFHVSNSFVQNFEFSAHVSGVTVSNLRRIKMSWHHQSSPVTLQGSCDSWVRSGQTPSPRCRGQLRGHVHQQEAVVL